MPHVATIFKRSSWLVICVALSVATLAHAQEPVPPPAYIAAIEGAATLEREGETTPAVVNMPLVPGDRVQTTAGRVEIRFPDGSGIEVAEFSAVELVTETRVRLLAGSLDRLEPLQPDGSAVSASYLPQDLKMYGATFDQYGSWNYAPDYGYVWYPTVAAGWRPYHYGYWEPVRGYGWTWIGADRWAWPTHHYGRWGYARGSWFWMPDRAFAGAWVSWGSAPGYVSWCPLGFDNRPVFALSAGVANAYSGWTVVSRPHFGARGFYAHRYAVDPAQLPRQTTFVTQSTPSVAVPRHIGNGAAASGGVAVPRAAASPVAVSPAVQPAPIVIPPVVSGRPTRAGTTPTPARPATSDQRPAHASPPTPPSQPQPSQQPQPPPQQAAPRAAPRQSTPQQPAPQQPSAQHNSNGGGQTSSGGGKNSNGGGQNSNGEGHGGGHQRAGTDGGSSNGTARRR